MKMSKNQLEARTCGHHSGLLALPRWGQGGAIVYLGSNYFILHSITPTTESDPQEEIRLP